MSTPSASGPAKLPINATTPQSHAHLNAFSSPAPAPRSVPSPAAQRHQAGRSPFNQASSHGHSQPPSTNSHAAQNHPTTASSASGPARLLDVSPANLPAFDSPAGMMPSLSSIGFDAMSMSMNPSAASASSNINLPVQLPAKLDDQERRRRLEAMASSLGHSNPRLSPEGIELVGQRLGLDCMLDPASGPRKDGSRNCILAGHSLAVELNFASGFNVTSVEVSASASSDIVSSHMKSASNLLLQDLTPPNISPILRRLDSFAKNLHRLADMDKPNGHATAQNFNCFEAVSGVYTSLKKLFDHEKKAAMILIDSQKTHHEARAERHVLSKGSGRPAMNAHGVVGLSLDYWIKNRHVFAPELPAASPDAMDLDSRGQDPLEQSNPDVYSLLIECEASPNEIYPPARISSSWISSQVEKQADNGLYGPVIDWVEPPPTYLSNSATTDPDSMALDVSGVGKLPDIRFVAKLNPPIVLPYIVAESILSAVGLDPPAEQMPWHHYSLLNIKDKAGQGVVGFEVPLERHIASEQRTQNRRSPCTHQNRLTLKTLTYARTITELPFSHPKQIVEVLPVLRQWATVNSLLSQSFKDDLTVGANANKVPISTIHTTFDASFVRFASRFNLSEEDPAPNDKSSGLRFLDRSMKSTTDQLSSQRSSLDNRNHDSIEIGFDVLSNGDITVVSQSGLRNSVSVGSDQNVARKAKTDGESTSPDDVEIMQKLAKGLDVAANLDVWVEWVKDLSRVAIF